MLEDLFSNLYYLSITLTWCYLGFKMLQLTFAKTDIEHITSAPFNQDKSTYLADQIAYHERLTKYYINLQNELYSQHDRKKAY